MDLLEWPPKGGARHPWEIARARLFGEILRDASRTMPSGLRILDVGAGDGWLAGQLLPSLPRQSEVFCWDRHYDSEKIAHLAPGADPRLRHVRDRPPGHFALILLLDVLEHVEDDDVFLSALIAESLATGGQILVSVPAYPALFSNHDRHLRHCRRYSPRDLKARLARSGLRVERHGGAFASLLPIRWMQCLREHVGNGDRRPPDASEWSGGRVKTGMVNAALRADASLSLAMARCRLPLPGLTWWAIGTKQRPRIEYAS